MSGLDYGHETITKDEGKSVIKAVKYYRESKNRYNPPMDDAAQAAHVRHLGKMLMGIENDEQYDRIQRKRELERWKLQQEEEKAKEARRQAKNRLQMLKDLKPRASSRGIPGLVTPNFGSKDRRPSSPNPNTSLFADVVNLASNVVMDGIKGKLGPDTLQVPRG